jgi:hypothetical protein
VGCFWQTEKDTGSKLGSVRSIILGNGGRLMPEAIIEGAADPDKLADLTRGTIDSHSFLWSPKPSPLSKPMCVAHRTRREVLAFANHGVNSEPRSGLDGHYRTPPVRLLP